MIIILKHFHNDQSPIFEYFKSINDVLKYYNKVKYGYVLKNYLFLKASKRPVKNFLTFIAPTAARTYSFHVLSLSLYVELYFFILNHRCINWNYLFISNIYALHQ